ncbi:hypothetical protein EDB86DRAFT_271935 [Lactarius hatsudake]|nr:hypothetical protein EDB86DRAFT_271935 [Lactarius hatsudake]
MSCTAYQRRSVWVHMYVKLLFSVSSGSALCQRHAVAAPHRRHRWTHALFRRPCGVTSLQRVRPELPNELPLSECWTLNGLNLEKAASSHGRSEPERADALEFVVLALPYPKFSRRAHCCKN